MMLDEAEIRLKDIRMPAYYKAYQSQILASVNQYYQHALKARRRGIDAADIVEPKIAYDLADRVAKMHEIDIAERLRGLLSQTTKEKAALKIAEEIAAGEYGALMLMVLVTTFVTPPTLAWRARHYARRQPDGDRPGEGGVDDLVAGSTGPPQRPTES